MIHHISLLEPTKNKELASSDEFKKLKFDAEALLHNKKPKQNEET